MVAPSSRDAALISALAARAPSDTTPALLELARRQAARKRPAQVLAQQTRDPFVRPSALDLRATHALDGLALAAASDYHALLLSPLAPLGCCAAVSPTHQDRIVSTLRGSEVVSDPTNVMALACAQQLMAAPRSHVRLCTIHQVVRAQRFAPKPGRSQHFRMFALAEAGLAREDHGFEIDAIIEQLRVMVRLCDALPSLGYPAGARDLTLLTAADASALGERLAASIASALPSLRVQRDTLLNPYYGGVRVMFGLTAPSGRRELIGDLGLFDWVAKLTSNRRVRFIASGFGLQLVPSLFGEP